MEIAQIFPAILAAVLFGNGIFWGFIWACWRLHRDSADKGAMAIAAFCLLVTGVIGLAVGS